MKKKRDWKKELEHLNIPYEIVGDHVYLWPQVKKQLLNSYGIEIEPESMDEIYRIIKRCKGRRYSQVLKEMDHKKERAKTKHLLVNDKEIPMGKVHYEDPWNWD